jgi:hypothetical protein
MTPTLPVCHSKRSEESGGRINLNLPTFLSYSTEMEYEPSSTIHRSALAIWSLALGILGILLWLVWGCFASVAAIICGHMALARVKKERGRLMGIGVAKAGLLLGYAGISMLVLWAIWFYIGIKFFGVQFQH